MKIGDLVTDKKGRTGMIVYRKSRHEIGVNFFHYPIMLKHVKDGKMTYPEMIKALKSLGCDYVFSKEDLNPLKP